MADAYIGSETGALKGIDYSRNVFQNYNNVTTLDSTREISRICRLSNSAIASIKNITNSQSTEEAVLCALVNRQLNLFDPSSGAYTTLFNCEGGSGPIKGLGQLESSRIVTCVESGEVSVWTLDGFTKESTMNVGENICQMRLSPTKPHAFATGGRENPLKLWDLHNPAQPIFSAKNVKNDWMNLRVPIWETDIRFSNANETIVTCTGHEHIRQYDPRTGQRRPVTQIEWGDCPFTSISMTPRENQVVAGNSKGCMGLFDLRGKGDSKLVHMYKGFAGSVSSIECHPTEMYVASCGIDRFARLHHLLTKEQMNKIFCKARLNCLLLNNDLSICRGRKAPGPEDGARESDDAYHTDEDQSDSDDGLWRNMRTANESKRGRHRRSESSEDSYASTESEGRAKPRRRKKRRSVFAATPSKRAASVGDSDSVASSPEQKGKLKRKKKMRPVLASVPSKRSPSPRLSPDIRKKKRSGDAADQPIKASRKRKAINSDVLLKMSKIDVGEN